MLLDPNNELIKPNDLSLDTFQLHLP